MLSIFVGVLCPRPVSMLMFQSPSFAVVEAHDPPGVPSPGEVPSVVPCFFLVNIHEYRSLNQERAGVMDTARISFVLHRSTIIHLRLMYKESFWWST